MLIIKLIFSVIFLALVGCASVPDKESMDLKAVSEAKTVELESVPEKQTEISPEVLYLLMTAEIAGQRNLYGVSLDGYLEAAKRVDDVRVAERAAKIGLYIKDTKKTSEAVSLWLKRDASNLTARKIAALSALKDGDKELALEHLNKMLSDDLAGFEASLLELTRVLGKEGKAGFIYGVLEELAQQHPEQASVVFVQALLAGQLNKGELVELKVNKALLLQPEWDKALVLRAKVFAQKRQFDKARLDLEKVLEKSPENNKIRKMLGQVLMKTDALDEAVAQYQQVLKVEPEDGESQFAIALIYLQQKKERQAVKLLKKLVNKPGWDAQASYYIGRIEFKNKQYDTALTWFDKVTRGGYEYDAAMAAVSVMLNQKNFAGAEQRLLKLTEKFPKQRLNIVLLHAEIFNEQKKHQQAFDLLSKGLIDFPGHRDLLYSRALIAEKIDRLEVLEADLKKILRAHPKDVSVLNALGYTLVDRTDRYQEAEVYLQQALDLKPEEAVIIDSMGWLKFKQGKSAEALVLLRKAYARQAENEIAAHLAEILWFVGEKDEARLVFGKALKKAPEDEYLLKFQQRLPDISKPR